MSLYKDDDITMEDMMQQVDKCMKKIHTGEIIKGKIIGITNKEISVNIGYMSDGIIPRSEITKNADEDLTNMFKIDDEISVYIMDINDGEGNVLLSKIKADEILIWKEIKKDYKDKKVFEVIPSEIVKGGVLTNIKGLRAFIPMSQLSVSYVKDAKKFINKNLKAIIIEVDERKGKIVLSSKKVEEKEIEENKNKLWDSLEKGQKLNGKVKKIVKFGAFVDIGGIEGLIHLSELSWGRVKNASEVVSVHDNVEVYVLDFNREEERLSLALKDINKNPWDNISEKFKIGDIVKGKVVKLMNFGAFVEIENGVEGLVHLSEICDENIAKPSEKLSINDEVKVKILGIDLENKKLSLSIKEAIQKPVVDYSKYVDEEKASTNLGDIFKKLK